MSNPAHLPYEHYLVTLAKRVEAPDAEYMPPTFPFNLFDEAKFAEAEYGEDMKKNFAIEEGIHFLKYLMYNGCTHECTNIFPHFYMSVTPRLLPDHGSFGATPKVVLKSQSQFRKRMESQAIRFFTTEWNSWLPFGLRTLGAFVNANPKDLVFVENATSAVVAVVTSMYWRCSDSLVVSSLGYGPINKFLKYYADRLGFRLITVQASVPVNMEKLYEDVSNAIEPSTKLVLLDHITSGTGLVLPIKRFAALCKSKNVPILVDGAHAIGQVPVDIKDINANFYVSNIHKWAFGAKGNAFLYIGRQHTGSVHPPVFGEGSGFGQLAEFSWAGTRDYTPYLTTFAALEFFKRAGGDKIIQHNHELAVWAAKELVSAWNTNLTIDSDKPEEFIGSMAGIRVPTNLTFHSEDEATAHALWLHNALWENYRIEIPIQNHNKVIYLRISCQIYNTKEDYIVLRDAIKEIYKL